MRRRDDRSSHGAADDGQHRYQMREKMVSIGDDFWIENGDGDNVFKVDGKAVRVRNTLDFKDINGNVVCTIQERKLRLKESMAILTPDGQQVAEVKKAIVSPVRDRISVEMDGSPDLDVKGNIVDHEYTLKAGDQQVAQVSKKWFRVRDSYGVDIAPGQNDIVILAVAVCIDQMSHDSGS